MIYPSIRIEGNIISQEILAKLEQGEYPGQLAKDFGFAGRTKVKDEIAFAWATAKDYWRIFQRKIERLPQEATATSETRADWMKPFLELLGYQIELCRADVLHEKTYAISHRDLTIGGFPIHIMGYRDDLDKKRAEGGPRMSPHGLLQEYLNISENLYGLVSNGHYLRLLRDSGRLVKLSFAEFDLHRMMEDDLYADFAIMYRLLHRSRMPKAKDLGAESLIERALQNMETGEVKLLLTHLALLSRRAHADLFAHGEYLPIEVRGTLREHVVAFLRRLEGSWALVAVPRLLTSVTSEGVPPLDRSCWRDTTLALPAGVPDVWDDAISGTLRRFDGCQSGCGVAAGDLFDLFPVSLLTARGAV